jgi:hypothetical protein
MCAKKGFHRTLLMPDLLIAATAEQAMRSPAARDGATASIHRRETF